MARLKLLNPVDWRELDWSKRIHMATILFFTKCSNESIYQKKGLNPAYFKVRKFFEKQEDNEINTLYDYLWSIDGKKVMSMYEVFQAKTRYTQQQRFIRVQPPNPTKVEEITLDDIMNL